MCGRRGVCSGGWEGDLEFVERGAIFRVEAPDCGQGDPENRRWSGRARRDGLERGGGELKAPMTGVTGAAELVGTPRGQGQGAQETQWVRGARLGGPEKPGERAVGWERGSRPNEEFPSTVGKGSRDGESAGLGGRAKAQGRGKGTAAGLWPPQKSAGVLARGLSFAELGTRHRLSRWRRRWRRFGPRLGPPRGSRRIGGRGRVSAGQTGGQGVWRAGT